MPGLGQEGRGLRAVLDEVVRLAASLERRLGAALFKDLLALYFAPTRDELRLWPEHPLIVRVVTEFELARDRGEIDGGAELEPANAAIFFFMGFFALLVTHPRSAARDAVLQENITVLLRGLEAR